MRFKILFLPCYYFILISTCLGGPDYSQKHYNQADQLFQQNKQAAFDYLTTQIEVFPQQLNYLVLRGKFLFDHGYVLSAQDDFTSAYNQGLRNKTLLISLAEITLDQDYKKSLQYLTETVKFDSQDDQIWAKKSILEFRSGQTESALKSIQKAISLQPKKFDYHQLYLNILLMMDKKNLMAKSIKNLLPQFKNQKKLYLKLIKIYLSQKKYQLAQKSIQEYLKKFPHWADLYFELGMTYLMQKKIQPALKQFLQGLKYSDQTEWVYIKIAKIYEVLKQNDLAVQYLIKARERGIKNLFLYRILSQHYNEQDQTHKAEKLILEGLESFPEDFVLLGIYGFILEKRGNIYDAIKAYSISLKHYKNNYFIYARLGRLFQILKQDQKALSYFKKSLILNKEAYWVRNLYVQSLTNLKKWKTAQKELDLMIQQDPQNFRHYVQKVIVEQHLKNYLQALADINKAIILAPKNAPLKAIEAGLLETTGKYHLADNAIQEALKLDPNNLLFLINHAYLQYIQNHNASALKTLHKFFNLAKPDLISIELFIKLNHKEKKLWNFQSVATKKTYHAILKKQFQKADQLIKKNLKKHIEFKFLDFLNKTLKEEKISSHFWGQDKRIVQRQKLNQLTAWQLYYIAYHFQSEKKYQKALNLLQKALIKKPQNLWIKLELAFIYEKLKKPANSVLFLQEYLKKYPLNIWARLHLALNYDQLNQPQKAEKIYLSILQNHPNEMMALNNLAWLYLTTKNQVYHKTNQALKLALKAVKIDPSSSNLDTLAEAYFQKKNYKKALEIIQKASDRNFENFDHFKRQKRKIEKALKDEIN